MPAHSVATQAGRAAGRPRIAFLAAFLDDEYEWVIWRGVRRAVEERGGSVVCFAGASFADPDPNRRARSRIFDFVDAAGVDGVLCLSNVLGHFVGVPGIERWLLERGVLTLSIGPAEHLPSVMVDDNTGVTQLMRHLIAHHGHRRIAFVTGNPSNAEAQRRLSTYIQVLADSGLSFDPRLTLTGDFTVESGTRAVRELFDARQVPVESVDAFVCSNDSMAFGAIEELGRRGITVPERMPVVGFDDVAAARTYRPSLTTVRQPLAELGRTGALRLFDLLDSGVSPGALTLDTELVLRRSCGCVPTDVPARFDDSLEEAAGQPISNLALEAAVAAELQGAAGTFARTLEPALRRIAAGDARRLDLGRDLADEFAARVRLSREDIVHQRFSRFTRVLQQRMFGPTHLISAALATFLPDFGLNECAVAELVPPAAGESGDRLKLAFGFDTTTREPLLTTFDARELVPPSFENLRTSSCVILPLTCGAETLGLAATPTSARDGVFYETLAELLGTVLKVLDLRRRAGG
jgi:DNA-binding LacI/PurR family transcriptional regulator